MFQIAITGILALGPVALGIITLFGRKDKKETDKKETDKNEKTLAPEPNAVPLKQPGPIPAVNTSSLLSTTTSQEKDSLEPAPYKGASSLSELLSTLLQDVPLNSMNNDETRDVPRESAFEWVPPLTSPPSRKMVVVEDEKGEKVLAPFQRDETRFYPFAEHPDQRPSEPNEPAEKQQHDERATPLTQTSIPAMETGKPSKPEKPEKPEPKLKTVASPAIIEPSTKQAIMADESHDIAGGALNSPGLVLITGPQGSGKSSLVLSIAGKSLASGADCIMVSYDKAVPALRDSIKNSGWDANSYESGFHLLLLDAFSGQSDSFSTELYCILKPFDTAELTETIERNISMMISGTAKVTIDSLNPLLSKITSSDLLPKLRSLAEKLKETGSTLIVTVDPSRLAKDTMSSLEDIATCFRELQGDGSKGGQLKVKKLNGAPSRLKPEEFEIQAGKGLLFT